MVLDKIRELASSFEKETKMVEKTDEKEFSIMRINLNSANLPACTMHPEKTRDHVLVIHGTGSPQAALYFCGACEARLLERLTRDYMTFPGLKGTLGPVLLPKE